MINCIKKIEEWKSLDGQRFKTYQAAEEHIIKIMKAAMDNVSMYHEDLKYMIGEIRILQNHVV